MASPFESQLQQPSIPPEVLAYDYINRARGRNYAELLKLDIRERELARKHQADEKSLERQVLTEAVQKEIEQKNIGKLQRIQYEQIYRNDNLRLSQLQKEIHQSVEPPLPKEHPFVKLVDQQDMRNSQLREKFKYQNRYNEIQESIKHSQKELNRRSDRDERQAYEQYVEDEFVKRNNSYKKLKLLHTERRMAGINDSDLNVLSQSTQRLEKDAQHQYLSFLQQQTEQKKHTRAQQRNNHSLNMRYGAVLPENGQSPAFLGLLPFQTDRQRQLDVIDRKFGFAVPKYLDTLAKNIRESQQRNSSRNEPNPEYGRLKMLTEGMAPVRNYSRQTSPVAQDNSYSPSKDLKLPSLRQQKPTEQTTATIDSSTKGSQGNGRKSSLIIHTQQTDRANTIERQLQRPSHKAVKSYNFITGVINTYQVPS